jgi:hypothetical protein
MSKTKEKGGLYWKSEREVSGEKLFGLGSELVRARL